MLFGIVPACPNRSRMSQQGRLAVLEITTLTLPLIQRAQTHQARTAIVAHEDSWTYRRLLDASARVAQSLLDGQNDLNEQRIAFLVPPGFDYVAVQWGIWRAGGICVPPLPDDRGLLDCLNVVYSVEQFAANGKTNHVDDTAQFHRQTTYGVG